MGLTIEELIERLTECGCCDEAINQFRLAASDNSTTELIHNLKKFRSHHQVLLDDACKHIDCIDYLIYEAEKNKK